MAWFTTPALLCVRARLGCVHLRENKAQELSKEVKFGFRVLLVERSARPLGRSGGFFVRFRAERKLLLEAFYWLFGRPLTVHWDRERKSRRRIGSNVTWHAATAFSFYLSETGAHVWMETDSGGGARLMGRKKVMSRYVWFFVDFFRKRGRKKVAKSQILN